MVAGGLVLLLACESEPRRTDDDDDGSSSATSGVGSSGSGGASTSSSTSSGSGGGGAGQPSVPYCLPACGTAADCDLGTPSFDADNYTCDAGVCVYQGCNDDAECQAVGAFVCREGADPLMLGAARVCVQACSTVADCTTASAPYDDDNYTCVAGGCQYQGCNSDSECQALGDYVCRDNGAGVAFCQSACAVAADCDIGGGSAYDADNYACEAGACVYLGCVDDDECLGLGDYVCSD